MKNSVCHRPFALFFLFVLFCLGGGDSLAGSIPFEGRLRLRDPGMDVEFRTAAEGKVLLNARQTAQDEVSLRMDLQHVRTGLFQLTSQWDMVFKRKTVEGLPVLEAKLLSRYSLVDFRPVQEMEGRLTWSAGRLELDRLSYAGFALSGTVDLSAQAARIDMSLSLRDVGLDSFLRFWIPDKKTKSEGRLFGRLDVNGEPDRLQLKGSFDCYNGVADELAFDQIRLHLEGTYPHIRVHDTLVNQSEGMSFLARGPIDLSRPKTYKRQIKDLDISPLVRNDEGETEWTLKKIEEDDGSLELKYLLRKPDNQIGDEEKIDGMFGIEKSMKF